MVVERGMVTLGEQDGEAQVREKIVSSLKEKYNIIASNDFEFVKVTQKKISVLHLSKQTEYNYDVVKKLVGQGLLYIRMKVGFEFVLNENHTSDSDSELVQGGALETITIPSTANSTSGIVQDTSNGTSGHVPATSNENSGIVASTSIRSSGFIPGTSSGTSDIVPHTSNGNSDIVTHSVADDAGIPSIYANTVQQEEEQKIESPHDFFCRVVNDFPPDIMEPTEMLRYLQKKIISGRPLEVTNSSQVLEGVPNFITVDRHNILETTFEELKHVADPRITFEVQFYGEQAVDSGGPRKEWIRLCNQKIKDTYSDNGLKEHVSDDYFYIGQMVCIALLQNGQLPVYIPEEILQAIFIEDQELPPCVRELKCDFSEEGSNMLIHEKAIYSKFVKYVRDVSSGRRVVTLGNILEFVTGTSEEPPLGFAKAPQIHFPVAEVRKPLTTNEGTGDSEEPPEKKKPIWHFMPTSHTCSNTCSNSLDLPRGNEVLPLPSDNELFELYDLAFKNNYFGLM
ncbi:uncharacterized protein LOC114961227 [Acropora millepora]|uniref:uncharacterized protein LOC114961227 n=1 Tax=Acropora millepora TaxID=45264 RepID=UPI001CF28477|nr:uncharacterized protein LOC114961227 [Acropora millepora]